MGNQQATQIELGWLAGIIDGEGYLGLSVQKDIRAKNSLGQWVTPMMHICNTDETIVLRAEKIMQKIGITIYVRITPTQNYQLKSKKVYKIQIKRLTNMILLLETIGSYLTGNKKERGQLMLEFCISRHNTSVRGRNTGHPFSDKELAIIEQCLPLQRRGASETIRKTQLEKSKIAEIQKQRIKTLNMKVIYPCDNCGEDIKDSPSRFKDHKVHFCNLVCRELFQQKNNQIYQQRSCEDIVRAYARA